MRNIITMIMAKPIRSVGKNTVPSITALVMVAEQLYRAWSLLHNHPYHRP